MPSLKTKRCQRRSGNISIFWPRLSVCLSIIIDANLLINMSSRELGLLLQVSYMHYKDHLDEKFRTKDHRVTPILQKYPLLVHKSNPFECAQFQIGE